MTEKERKIIQTFTETFERGKGKNRTARMEGVEERGRVAARLLKCVT